MCLKRVEEKRTIFSPSPRSKGRWWPLEEAALPRADPQTKHRWASGPQPRLHVETIRGVRNASTRAMLQAHEVRAGAPALRPHPGRPASAKTCFLSDAS